ncbi:MAG TPA: peroxiredoxin [Planctomycetaceae bacterium]|nr:peroxiredoxin [Planctomycetaceae bacterium]
MFLANANLEERRQDKKTELKVGDKAPVFEGFNDQNKKWISKKYASKKIYVVYFYPADMTPDCTKQACGYRDALAEMDRKDVEVIGISGDTVENHQHFKREYKLNFTLLSDTDGKIAEAFGVPTDKGGEIERKISGEMIKLKRGRTAKRWTFVIDKQWKIVYKDTAVKAAKDSTKVLEVIKRLTSPSGSLPLAPSS